MGDEPGVKIEETRTLSTNEGGDAAEPETTGDGAPAEEKPEGEEETADEA